VAGGEGRGRGHYAGEWAVEIVSDGSAYVLVRHLGMCRVLMYCSRARVGRGIQSIKDDRPRAATCRRCGQRVRRSWPPGCAPNLCAAICSRDVMLMWQPPEAQGSAAERCEE